MADNNQNKDAIREEAGIRPLIKLLDLGGEEAQANAAHALALLAFNSQNKDAIREEAGIRPSSGC